MLKDAVQLMRLDKPIGIYLLWFPTAWALHLAYGNHIPIDILCYFLLGTIFMRSAGCIINDMADKDFDAHVWRTKNRPLAQGQVSMRFAWILLGLLLLASFIILLQLPENCFWVAIFALGIVGLYPFCKRFLPAPQLVLSLAFSMSIPMVNVASHQVWTTAWSILMLINMLWILAYDTEYALADLEDDKKIGIFSTARFFGKYVRPIIALLQITLHLLWLPLAKILNLNIDFQFIWLLTWGFWFHQWFLLTKNQKELDFKAFKLNAWYGLVMWIAVVLSLNH